MRYGEIFHEPKASEMSRSISSETSLISDLSYTDGKCTCAVECQITVEYHGISHTMRIEKYCRKYIKYRINNVIFVEYEKH